MKILIIDDEKNICLTLQNILEDEGYTVETANSGEEGLKQFDTFYPDLLLLDVKMRGIDGLQVLEQISRIDKSVPVIMISGNSNITEAVRAIKLGAFDFLEKPLSLPKVKVTVQKALEFRQMSEYYQQVTESYSEQYRMIGNSHQIQELSHIIDRVASTNAKVLIRGESGTGKELIAWAVHQRSPRANKTFVKFNSAAIPKELVESELFGFEKGAFTGAVKAKKGKLEQADGGTLFLDEIGDMDLSAQAKILRVIQEGEFERVGSTRTLKINTRIIAATHKNLEELVQQGLFREDLFYRLNVVPIVSPALREHPEDIPALLQYFARLFAAELKLPCKEFSSESIQLLQQRPYPGNVRELRNLVERIYILTDEVIIKPHHLPEETSSSKDADTSFWNETKAYADKKKEFESRYLERQLLLHDGNITHTAEALGLQVSNLSRKLKELDIKV